MTIDELIGLIDAATPEQREQLRDALRVDVPDDDDIRSIAEHVMERDGISESAVESIARRVVDEALDALEDSE